MRTAANRLTRRIRGSAITLSVGLGAGGLIGRIGTGKPFRIGSKNTLPTQEAGKLYLGINDNVFGDNSGEFRVTVIRP